MHSVLAFNPYLLNAAAAAACRTAVPDLAMHRWFIFTTWGMLAVVGGLLVLLYNLYPDRSLDAWVDRSAGVCDRLAGAAMAAPTILGLHVAQPHRCYT
jgi:hypothetical protein